MDFEEMKEKFPIGSQWRLIKDFGKDNDLDIAEYAGCECVVLDYMEDTFYRGSKKSTVQVSVRDRRFAVLPEWLEPIDNPTWEELYRRQRDENLRSIFGG